MCLSDRAAAVTASTVFALAGALHLVRLVNGWDLVLGPWSVPAWVSGVVVVLAGYLSWRMCPFAGKTKKKK